MQVPQWAGAAVGRPHSHRSKGRAGTQCYVRGGGANALGPRIPVLNNSVVVELHLKIKREPTQSNSRSLRVSK